MGIEALIGVLGILVTLLLVGVGLLNFSIFRKQLLLAQEQINTAVRQLELVQKQPDLYLIQRAITEASDHVRLFLERPKLRPYFYDDAEWKPGDEVSLEEVKAMAELVLNNFASALMHSAAFPEYPVRGIDRTIMFHLRHSPALRDFLIVNFERFPFSGLTMLYLQSESKEQVEAQLRRLIEVPGMDDVELRRRRELLALFQSADNWEPIEFTAYSMKTRR
jgi:hypothetical protein